MMLLTLADAAAQTSAGNSDEEALLYLYGNEEMISIATGTAQPVARAPAVATVITSSDIETMGATDLDEVLESVPGLHVSRNPAGYNPIYVIRGIYSDYNPQVLMLINGVPINTLFTGNRHQVWAGMPVDVISRIEIIRGPGSAIYGADAFAGVINIITKGFGDIDGGIIGARTGSFNSTSVWGGNEAELGAYKVAVTAEYGSTDGQHRKIYSDAQTHLDAQFKTTASRAPDAVNLGRKALDIRLDVLRGRWRARAGLQQRDDVQTGAGVAQALDPRGEFASRRINADLTYHNATIAPDWDFTAQLSALDTSQEVDSNVFLYPPGAVVPIGPDGNINPVTGTSTTFTQGVIGNPEVFERQYRFDVSSFYTGIERHEARIGAGIYYGEIYKVKEAKNYGPGVLAGGGTVGGEPTDVSDTQYAFLPEDGRTNYYTFLQDVWNFANDWELTSGLRYDHYSDFGDTVNPRLALVWSTRHDLTTKLLYGRAFRAPSFAETRNRNNPVALGNPALDPETIQTIELAFDYRPSAGLRLGLNVFHYNWDDIILFVPDPGGTTRTAQNAGRQAGEGLELEAEWQAARNLRLIGNYAFQRAEEKPSGADPGNAPAHEVYARAEWQFAANWLFSPQLTWVGQRARPPGDTRPPLHGYTLADLTLRRKNIEPGLDAALSIRNLFDADAREPSPSGDPVAAIPNDLPLAGRSAYAELRYRF